MRIINKLPIKLPNILIVDDRKENLVATHKILKNITAHIMEAESGNEALSKMIHNSFACVLLDVQMPEMDGFEVATLMREQDEMKDIPIIFVTAISKEEKYVDKAAKLGAVDYIFKPINPNILKSKVQVYVDLYIKQQQLNNLNETLTKSNDELERFAYICSHDLQEPARMMGSFSELLEIGYKNILDDKGKNYLNFIRKNSFHMQNMINDILTFSRIGREDIIHEEVNPNEMIFNIQEELQQQIKETKTILNFEDLPIVQSNKTLINMVLENLICNALKFKNNKSSPVISIKANEQKEYWIFSVEDNGIGIKSEHEKKVFTIFQRIYSKEKYPGTGIGLSTCKKLIELYGGKIWFESEIDKGTIFFFTIPKIKMD